MATDIKSNIRQLFEEAWNKGNLRVVDDLCSNDFVMHNPVSGDLNRDAFKQFISTYRGAFPDLRFRLDDILVAGDMGICRWSATGTQRGELMGIPPTNKTATVTGISIARITGDKQKETWVEWDALGMLRNMGVLPSAGAGAGVQPQAAQQPSRPEARH